MSKYAVVKIGALQEKVSIGDELVVSSSFSETTLIPILVSPKKGQIVSDSKELGKFKVEIEHIGDAKSKKINIFQYKNKTGNRRSCLLYTSPSPRDAHESRMPSSA